MTTTGSDERSRASGGDLPLAVRLADLALGQVETSVLMVLPLLKDFQGVYAGGMMAMARAGAAIERRSKSSFHIMENFGNAFERTAPALLQAQLEIADIAVKSTQLGIQLLRKTIKGASPTDY
jgi:hypothetical protein